MRLRILGGGLLLFVASTGCRAALECTVQADDDVPTVLHVQWTSDVAQRWHVEYGVDGAFDASTPEQEGGAGPHDVLLLGLPALADVDVRLVIEEDGGERVIETVGETGGLPRTCRRSPPTCGIRTQWPPSAGRSSRSAATNPPC